MNLGGTLRRVGVALSVGYLAAEHRRKNPVIMGQPASLVIGAAGIAASEFGSGLVRSAGVAALAGTAPWLVRDGRAYLGM